MGATTTYIKRGIGGSGSESSGDSEAPMSYDGLPDEELVTLLTLGEKEALAELYSRHVRAVYSLVLHLLQDTGKAEEVTQEVFLNLWKKAATFRPERGKFLTWLLTTAHHRTIDELRRTRRQRNAFDEIAQNSKSEVNMVESPLERAERLEEAGTVHKALEILPPEQLQVVVLAYYKGYSQSEIAQILNHPLGTVKTRMRLAMQKMRASLSQLSER